jgi:NAD-dependent deacetylase
MKKIVIFTGAGISAESGVETFRGAQDSTWNNINVEEVATAKAWQVNRTKLLDFYNKRNAELDGVEPNSAHTMLADLEKDFDVTVITQNVDDLHERGGSTNILHLHGELKKMREYGKHTLYDYKEIKEGDLGPKGKQLRPHVVWFGEMPFNVNKSYEALMMADYLIIVGTSFQITYTLDMIRSVNSKCEVFYIDPTPARYFDGTQVGKVFRYVEKSATEGVKEVCDIIIGDLFG